jgi:hypothetical protein
MKVLPVSKIPPEADPPDLSLVHSIRTHFQEFCIDSHKYGKKSHLRQPAAYPEVRKLSGFAYEHFQQMRKPLSALLECTPNKRRVSWILSQISDYIFCMSP